MDLTKYWNDVREVVAMLPEGPIVYLISLDNPEKGITAGRVMDMSDRKMAARRIVERTHELAKPHDIARFQAVQQKQLEDCAETEQDRKGQLAMPKDLQVLVREASKRQLEEDRRLEAGSTKNQKSKE
jgi:hypothetical protein